MLPTAKHCAVVEHETPTSKLNVDPPFAFGLLINDHVAPFQLSITVLGVENLAAGK